MSPLTSLPVYTFSHLSFPFSPNQEVMTGEIEAPLWMVALLQTKASLFLKNLKLSHSQLHLVKADKPGSGNCSVGKLIALHRREDSKIVWCEYLQRGCRELLWINRFVVSTVLFPEVRGYCCFPAASQKDYFMIIYIGTA